MKKSDIVLYGVSLPAILLLITPVGLIPVGYNLVLNFLVLFPAIWIMNKRINGKLMLKTILLSWLIAVGGMILGFIISLWCGETVPVFTENRLLYRRIWVVVGFIIGTAAVFVGHYFMTFGKRFRETVNMKTRQRVAFSCVMTVINAPYCLFIPVAFLVALGFPAGEIAPSWI